MAQFSLRDLKKHASFFLRDRFNDARLALTDVSRIQLLAEEATNEDPWGPEPKTMAILADGAFELEEYERITQVIRNRLAGSKQRPWRQLYKTLVLLEYLLIRGPVSIGKDFRGDIFCFEELSEIDFKDEQGGSMVHKIADRVMKLLDNPELTKDERIQARKLSFGIQGFGNSVNQMPFPDDVQGGEQKNDKNVLPLPKQLLDVEPNVGEPCRGPRYNPPSAFDEARQSNQVGLPKDQKVVPKTLKKGLSSLAHFKEKRPYFGRQTLPDEDGASDEEVSVGLLDKGEEKWGLSPQGVFQVNPSERACQLVTC